MLLASSFVCICLFGYLVYVYSRVDKNRLYKDSRILIFYLSIIESLRRHYTILTIFLVVIVHYGLLEGIARTYIIFVQDFIRFLICYFVCYYFCGQSAGLLP